MLHARVMLAAALANGPEAGSGDGSTIARAQYPRLAPFAERVLTEWQCTFCHTLLSGLSPCDSPTAAVDCTCSVQQQGGHPLWLERPGFPHELRSCCLSISTAAASVSWLCGMQPLDAQWADTHNTSDLATRQNVQKLSHP